MRDIIAHLNNHIDKTPDEIVKTLFCPWRVLRGHTIDWYQANRKRGIILFNIHNRDPGYHTNGGRVPDMADAVVKRIGHWPSSVFTSLMRDNWFFAFEEEAVPFIMGVHDVQALANFECQRQQDAG